MNINGIKTGLSTASSALKAAQIAEEMARDERVAAAIARETAERDATLMAGAEASIEQAELLQQQLAIIREQNGLLGENYEKLKELYDIQVRANVEAKEELKRSKRYNAWMMVISIVAMLIGAASAIIPFFEGAIRSLFAQ